jgi:hypothetical protein
MPFRQNTRPFAVGLPITREMGIEAPGPDVLSRDGFAEVAESFEGLNGRKALIDRISSAVLHPGAFGPTPAHIAEGPAEIASFPILHLFPAGINPKPTARRSNSRIHLPSIN